MQASTTACPWASSALSASLCALKICWTRTILKTASARRGGPQTAAFSTSSDRRRGYHLLAFSCDDLKEERGYMIQKTVIAALFAVATLAAAPVKVDLKDAMGKPVGSATISAAKTGGVVIHMKLMGLP